MKYKVRSLAYKMRAKGDEGLRKADRHATMGYQINFTSEY